ncbi:MAG TPA: hypothetical protein VN578_14520 [Candidatus Binatia bacterium]|jgi:hypothetical protein|nr:hypothetical protein [Candidatus Binatia bacterium]
MIKVAGLKQLAGPRAVAALGCALAASAFAGQSQKWEQVPEAVRATILAQGGKVGGPVDIEGGKIHGKAIYEAPVKDKDGHVSDLVVTEDGKLVETKTDDAADKAAEQVTRAKKPSAAPTFTHPREITNLYLPLASLKQDILEGKEAGNTVHIERTSKPDRHKTFKIGKQSVEALVVEDRETENGELAEVAIDYFAQADDSTVYYLGEEVDEFKDGKVVSHEGAWMYGKDTKKLTPLMPGNPQVGDKFRSEDVSKTLFEDDEVVSLSETVTVPTGTYHDCVKIKETLPDGKIEYKYFAKGVGCIREMPEAGDVVLKSHTTRSVN